MNPLTAFFLGLGWAASWPPLLEAASRLADTPLHAVSTLAAVAIFGLAIGRSDGLKRRPSAALAAWASGLFGLAGLSLMQRAWDGSPILVWAGWAAALAASASAGAALREANLAPAAAGAAAGTLMSGLILTGWLGERATTAAAAGVVAAAACRLGAPARHGQPGTGFVDGGPSGEHPAWPSATLALACACAVLWMRAASMLLGYPLLGAAVAASSLLAGMALGAWLASQAGHSSRAASRVTAGFSLALAAAGLLCLNLLRSVALSAGEAIYLVGPLNRPSDFWLILVPCWLSFLPSGALIGAMLDSGMLQDAGRRLWLAPGLAGGALGAGFLLDPGLGNGRALAAAHLMILALAVRAKPLLRILAPAAAAAVLLAWSGAGLWRDMDVNRLNSASPGSRILERHAAGGRSLAAVELPAGEQALLRDGLLAFVKGDAQPLIPWVLYSLSEKPGRLLLFGFGDAVAAGALRRMGFQIRAVEPEGFREERGPYDVAYMDLPRPLGAPPASDVLTGEFLGRLKKIVVPGGLAAVWLPLPAFEADILRAASTFGAQFPFRTAWSQPGWGGILLLGSARPLKLRNSWFSDVLRAAPVHALGVAREPEGVEAEMKACAASLLGSGRQSLTADRSPLQFPLLRLARGRACLVDSAQTAIDKKN